MMTDHGRVTVILKNVNKTCLTSAPSFACLCWHMLQRISATHSHFVSSFSLVLFVFLGGGGSKDSFED